MPAPTPLTLTQRQAIIDKFGRAQRAVDDFKPTKDEHAALRAQIAGWYENAPGDKPFIEEGKRFTLQVSECSNERTISSMAWLWKFLGVETFLKLCKFPLGAVDASVPKPRHKEFLTEARTGAREIKAVAKSAPARIAA